MEKEQVLPETNNASSHSVYKPPPQFKQITTPPILSPSLPDNAELWLVRIQDNQVKPDELKGKQVSLAFDVGDGKLGSFKNSKGSLFEILDLCKVAGAQPFAFLPKNDSSLEVRRIDRQVAIVQNLDSIPLSKPPSSVDNNVSLDLDDGKFFMRSPHTQKQAHTGGLLRETGNPTREKSTVQSASISMGLGSSAVESLQTNEERISNVKLEKSSKKSKRDQSSRSIETVGISTGEMVQDGEDNMSARKIEKIGKGSGRDYSGFNSEASLSPSSLHRNSEGHHTEASPNKKALKHKKRKHHHRDEQHLMSF